MIISTAQEIEAFVASTYLNYLLKERFVRDKLLPGSPPEPDMIYDRTTGIEVGYVGSPQNIASDIQELEFVERLNQRIGQRLPAEIYVRLVMQDDKDVVDHSPSDGMEPYPTMTSYLDGIFVHKGWNRMCPQVDINQKTSMRPQNLFPRANELQKLADELVSYVASLRDSDYSTGPHSDYQAFHFHHRVVCKGVVNIRKLAAAREDKGFLESLVPEKIVEKMKYNKYKEDYDCRVLLLHNWMPKTGPSFDSNTHLYTHYRDALLMYLRHLISEFDTAKKYDCLVFLDFSTNTDPQKPSVYHLVT